MAQVVRRMLPLARVPRRVARPQSQRTRGTHQGKDSLLPIGVKDRLQRFGLRVDGAKAIHWEADLAQPQGRSVVPMLDTQGRVIGICTGKMNGKGYYLAIDEIFYLLEKGGYRFLLK